jgi:hypothetical protein
MEISVTIELKGEPDEVGLMLAQLGETLIGEETANKVDASWWTPEKAAAFVTDLTDPALQALALIADNAPNVSFRDVQREMGMTGLQLAGRLSSIGFAVARQGGPVPFVRDYYRRSYSMDPEVAEVLTEAIAKETARRAGGTQPRRRGR